MYAFAEKTNVTRKTKGAKNKLVVQQKKSLPAYVLRDISTQRQNEKSCGIVQRYPVEVEDGKLIVTSGRPRVPDTNPFREGLCERIYEGGYQSAFEMDIQKKYPNRADAVKALSHKGRYRSRENVTNCHKVSIYDIECILVKYANTGKISNEFVVYLEMIGFETEKLNDISNATTLDAKKDSVNRMIYEINGLCSNYYLGNMSTNSAIGSHCDPHVDFETGQMSPISSYAFEHQEAMGITPTKSDGYGGYYTSSFFM